MLEATRPPRRARAVLTFVLGLGLALAWAHRAAAQAPPGYYDSVDATDAASLRHSLHEIIDDHDRLPYTSSSLDTWDVLEVGQEDPGNPGRIIDVFRNASYAKQGGGNSLYNREHSWPKSYGFPIENSSNYPYTDAHHLFLCDDGYNSSRSNKPFDTCDGSCSEKTTDFNNGLGGGSGWYPGNSNWTAGSGAATGVWETWRERRGDMARALFYMDVRYEGGFHGVTGAAEPDLILTDNRSLIEANSQSNRSVAYMGVLSVLIQWHYEDPVDDFERQHNEAVYAGQGNRNPFVDNERWADCVFDDVCDGGTGDPPPPPPPPPGGAGSVFINEFHYDNSGSDKKEFVEVAGPAGTDLAGWQLVAYNGNGGGAYQTIALSGTFPDQGSCMGTLAFPVPGLQNGAPDGIALIDGAGGVVELLSYEGTFTAADGPAAGRTSIDVGVSESSTTGSNQSLQRTGTGNAPADFTWSGPGSASSGDPNAGQTFSDSCGGSPAPAGDPWINELHYDNASSDVGEFVEIAGPAGTDMTGWELVGYNGANGEVYSAVALSGTIPSQQGGVGTLWFTFSGLQNGSPDGIALVRPDGTVVEFASYEGALSASNGPAAGTTSVDIGVSESSATPAGESLQRAGTGCGAGDFTWSAPGPDTPGSKNAGQTFSCP